MKRLALSFTACLLLLSSLAPASGQTLLSITWQSVTLSPSGERQSVAEVVTKYDPASDVEVQRREKGPTSNYVILDENHALSADVPTGAVLEGLAFSVYRKGDDNSFSWEWFDRIDSTMFRKRQGAGRVRVTTKKAKDSEELQSIEFLDGIALRYLDDMKKPPGTHTHEVHIRKGSIFRIAP